MVISEAERVPNAAHAFNVVYNLKLKSTYPKFFSYTILVFQQAS